MLMMGRYLILVNVIFNIYGSASAGECSIPPTSGEVEEIQERIEIARQLSNAGEYERSLEELLLLYDEGPSRMKSSEILLGNIARLAIDFPQAQTEMEKRREEIFKRIECGQKQFHNLRLISAINYAFEIPEENVRICDRLGERGSEYADIQEECRIIYWRDYVICKRYNDIELETETIARDLAIKMGEYDAIRDFPDASVYRTDWYEGYLSRQIRTDSILIFEALLANGNTKSAERIMKWTLRFETTAPTCEKMIILTNRFGGYSICMMISTQAEKSLSKKEYLGITDCKIPTE